jgi:hypothetical protein
MLRDDEDYSGLNLEWGAIVGICELVDCVQLIGMSLKERRKRFEAGEHFTVAPPRLVPQESLQRFPWLPSHPHTRGPVCWILQRVRRLDHSVPCRGIQSLFNAPPAVLREIEKQLGAEVHV